MSITVKDIPAGESKAFRQPVDDNHDIRGASVKKCPRFIGKVSGMA